MNQSYIEETILKLARDLIEMDAGVTGHSNIRDTYNLTEDEIEIIKIYLDYHIEFKGK